jgi:hypothetical protein
MTIEKLGEFAPGSVIKRTGTRRSPWGTVSVARVGYHQRRLYSLLEIAHNLAELIRQCARSGARRFLPPVDHVQVLAIRTSFP